MTIEALRIVHAKVQMGMSSADISALMDRTTVALGGSPEFSLVLLNEASAYPHGSVQAQTVREGSIILMDCGCAVHGYQSDISRTWVFGHAERAAAQGLEHRQARAGNRTGNGKNRRSGGRHR